uniref:Transmembrane protein n=1 Tax=Anopheles minimus TaxID=112268 RepID=A0A182WLQ6_9DIPT
MASFSVKCSLLLVSVSMVIALTSAADDLPSDINRGSLVRVARNPQQPQGFPNFPPPQFPFANPEIVSQDTQRDKNGFAQTTIYKYPNGMGSSSVSTSYSGSSKLNGVTCTMMGAIAILLLKMVY